MRTLPRRTLALPTIVATVIGAGVVAAFAAWNTSGTGSATAAAGTATEFIVTVETVGGLYPTGSAKVGFTVENTNPYPVTLSQATAQKIAVDAKHPGCDPGVVTAKDIALSDVVGPGETSPKHAITVSMSGAATDPCQGASFNFTVLVTGTSS